jgi:1,2-diacylglycerol 3-beta-galactosyltransferase
MKWERNDLSTAPHPPESDDQKQVLILTADAGYGHRSAALAIEAAIQERYGDCYSTAILNPLHEEGSPSILQTLSEGSHDRYVQSELGLYDLGYRISDGIATAALMEQVFSALLHDPLEELLARTQPDVVISTYPFFLEPLSFVVEHMGETTPLVSVITDLVTVHTIWFNPRVDLCLVPTKEARQKALRRNVPADRIHVTGLPVHPRFGSEKRSSAEIRAELGWQVDLPAALIVGGTRVSNVLNVARLIDLAGLNVQLAIVAGGDKVLHAQLKAEAWRGEVHVYGFVDDMSVLMHASDLVFAKAGGLIVSETLACGRPMILFSSTAGQETGNVEYVTSNQAGDWAPTPTKALTSLVRWLANDGSVLAERTANARRAGRPQAVYAVVDLVLELVETGPRPTTSQPNLRKAARLPLKARTQVSRAIDKLEQELRGVTDAELARLATWCVNQIEAEGELKRIADIVRQRIKA